MDYKLELVILPTADVDRSKAFYTEGCGFKLEVDHSTGPEFRVVQLTPEGSRCSIAVGIGITDAPAGSVRGLHLVVPDIVAASDELRGRDVEVSAIRHLDPSTGEWRPGPHPERNDYESFADFTDPDGNTWLLQERKNDPWES